MSKDNIIVVDYDFKTLNWVYVVLSRVRTRNGLFLYHELDRSKIKQPDQALIKDNKCMMEIEKKTTSKRTKWIHSQLSFKQINIISLSINNLTHKNTYKI